MAKVHSKETNVSLNAVDISSYTNSTTYNRSASTHELTCYGLDDAEFGAGIRSGTITIGGFYDTTAVTGPGAAIEPLLGGAAVEFVYRIEGTGVGKPEKSCDVLVADYNESSPVADYATWTAELTITGPVTKSAQA
jgi:hypothetical protein